MTILLFLPAGGNEMAEPLPNVPFQVRQYNCCTNHVTNGRVKLSREAIHRRRRRTGGRG